MTKYEYLAELEKKLDMLSYEDKNQALEYYESYFEDAGKENIAKVIEELGSPEELAKYIEILNKTNIHKYLVWPRLI